MDIPNGGRILTCVYCGHEYPQGTPASGDAVLTSHIRVCEKHPLRAAEEEIKRLRTLLAELVEAGRRYRSIRLKPWRTKAEELELWEPLFLALVKAEKEIGSEPGTFGRRHNVLRRGSVHRKNRCQV